MFLRVLKAVVFPFYQALPVSSNTHLLLSLGGYIANRGLNIPFYCTSLMYLITGIVSCVIMKENNFEKMGFSFKKSIEKMRDTWNKSCVFTKKDEKFRFILYVSAVQMFAVMAPNMEWQKVFSDLGFGNSFNGIIGGIIHVVIILGYLLTNVINQHIKEEKMQIIFTQIFLGLFIGLTVSFANIYPVVAFFCLQEVCRGMSGPMIDHYVQKCITSSNERATLSSFQSMVEHLGGALGLICSGLIAKCFSIQLAWLISGFVLVIAMIFIAKDQKRRSC